MTPTAMEPLFSREIIAERVGGLAARIASDYDSSRPVLLGILKGSFIFFSDLIRGLTIDADIDFVQVSSYGSSQVSSGTCVLKKDTSLDIAQRDIIIVDDIIDTGLTVAFLRDHLLQRQPRSIKVCCLIDKQVDRARAVSIDYSAFTLHDGFVVGYGLDFDEQFRGLPEIYRLQPS